MTRRERLMATLAGLPVDRPAVSFYELNALDQDPGDEDPYNIYSHPSWKALLDLTREKTDHIVMRKLPFENPLPKNIQNSEHIDDNNSLHTTQTLNTNKHTFNCRTQRDLNIDTIWHLEHWLKHVQDLQA